MSDETTSKEPTAESGSVTAKAKRAYKKSSKKAVKKVSKKVAKKAKGSTGTRYPEEVKAEAVALVNGNPGKRGIIGEVMRKYGVSYISLRNWLKNAGKGKKAAKVADKPKGTGKRGRPSGKSSNSVKSSGSADTFENLVAEIRTTKAHLKDLVARLGQAV